jgi:hypothetical protein
MQRFSDLPWATNGREERNCRVLGLPCQRVRPGGCNAALLPVFLHYDYRTGFRAVAHFLTPNV